VVTDSKSFNSFAFVTTKASRNSDSQIAAATNQTEEAILSSNEGSSLND